jgi:hypothetical protein
MPRLRIFRTPLLGVLWNWRTFMPVKLPRRLALDQTLRREDPGTESADRRSVLQRGDLLKKE